MRPSLVVLVLLIPLAACASKEPATAERDPYADCRQQGLPVGSGAFESCLERAIARHCAADGEPVGGLERQLCARRLQDQALISRELERRGSRSGFDQLLGN